MSVSLQPDTPEIPEVPVTARSRFNQGASVVLPWRRQHLGYGAGFDDAPFLHDDNGVANLRRNAQIMGDEQDTDLGYCTDILEQIENLSLNRNIERRHGLIGHQEIRTEGQSTGNAYALSLPSGKLMRIASHDIRSEADQSQEFTRLCRGLLLRRSEVDVAGVHAPLPRPPFATFRS